LIDAGRAYPCFCSGQELKRVRGAQRAAGQPPRYPGTCAKLDEIEIQNRLARGLQPSLRFRVPQDEIVGFEDLVRGPQRFASSDIGDFIIRRSDSTPAFFFSNAVDDALMGITHVLRGEDHLTNTPRQLLLLKAFDYGYPAYGHIALLIGGDGSPLSKRRGATSLRELREEGYLPQAINNYLARLGHVYEQTGFLSPEALVAGFDLSRLGHAPARYDGSQLRHWQKEAVAHASDADLWRWLESSDYPQGARIQDWVPDDRQLDFVRAVRDNIELPMEASDLAGGLFRRLPSHSTEAQDTIRSAGEAFFEAALAELTPAVKDFNDYARAVSKRVGIKGKALFMPLRAALTGETHGPEMARLFPLLGIERLRPRLEAALKIASN
jgi:glutamyl-tRNA synthetase